MSAPSYTRTWLQNTPTGLPGTRIPYTSLIQTLSTYVYGLKEFFKANGMVVVASCTGAATALADLISSPAQFTTRGATDTVAQSWILLSDGNGGQLLLAYTGTTDDKLYIGYSPGALYTTGVLTRPTATDAQALPDNSTTASAIGTSTTGDRIWHAIISSDAKAYRWVVVRQAEIVGSMNGIEAFTPCAYAANVTVNPVVAWNCPQSYVENVGFFVTDGNSTASRFVKLTVQPGAPPATLYNLASQKFVTGLSMGADYGTLYLNNYNLPPELQGNLGFFPNSVLLTSTNNASAGVLGLMVDFWVGTSFGGNYGQRYYGLPFDPDYKWFMIGALLWPNPSQQTPMMW